MTEQWKDIKGYEGSYKVSSIGRIMRKYGKLMKPTTSRQGYFGVGLSKDGHAKRFSVARLVALNFIPNPENKPYVNHIDGNKQNNVVDNLEWTTHSENLAHAYRIGLNVYVGKKHYCAKRTKVQVGTDVWEFDTLVDAAKHLGVHYDAARMARTRGIIMNNGAIITYADPKPSPPKP